METFFALLTGISPSQRSVTRSFDVFSEVCLNNRDTGGLRRHHAHYDFIMSFCHPAQDVFEFSGHERSGDVLTHEGDSFTFYCTGEAAGGYLQV